MAKAKIYTTIHSNKFAYNPTVVEERLHRRDLEATDVARRVAAEAETNRHREVNKRREQAEDTKIRQLRDQRLTRENEE